MKSSAIWLLVCFLLYCPGARSQTLVYSLSYVDTAASSRARFANVSPVPGLRTKEQNLAMMRNTRRTEIDSVSITNGKRALLFSDEGTNLELKATGAISAEGKAYIPATLREWTTTPATGIRSEEGVYEISLDGSQKFRRVLGAQQNQPPPLLNPQSTKAVFERFVNGKWVVSIYSVPEWRLLEAWGLAGLTNAHCPDCRPLSYGWLADGKRLYFELGLVGEESAEHPEIRDTTYIVSESGADLGPIPPEMGVLRLPGYVESPSASPQFLGQLPDGSYLFKDYAVPKKGPIHNPKPYLVVFHPGSKSQKQFPLKFSIGRVFISPSGRYLAYIEDRLTSNYRTERDLWTIDLDSGAEKDWYTAPPPGPPSSPKPNVFLNVLGWLDKN